MNTCRICGNDQDNLRHEAREMMFGLRDAFTYLECSDCGCLQLIDPPADMSRYYPRDYYSYDSSTPRRLAGLDAFFKKQRARYILEGEGFLGPLLVRQYGITPQLRWLHEMDIGLQDAILDVGCGAGELLLELQRDGFSDLTGVDPYIEWDLDYGDGLVILKKEMTDLERSYDLVMMHHSLEHLPQPGRVFEELARLIRPGGHALIRIPVCDSQAWRAYGVDWVQLDAPRHLFLHTRKSLGILAQEAGLTIERVENDSTAFQFWGSELYKRNIALREEDSDGRVGMACFSPGELDAYAVKAEQLNATDSGDQIVCYLKKSQLNS